MAPVRPNPTLSDDLISEILVRVPVKSLLCFQSVSKAWLSLIKHPAFVKAQLLHSNSNETDQTLIMSQHKLLSLVHVDFRQIVADLKLPHLRGEEVKPVRNFHLIGSANGIVCVVVNFCNFELRKIHIYLWNPAIKQSKLIPSLSCDMYAVRALGFGYDGVDHDFKVVSLVLSRSSFRVEVYSDNRNAWRNASASHDCPRWGVFDVCINGFLCGIGRYYGMMAFDLNQEVLNCGIKLPIIDDAHAQHLLNCAIKLPVINDAHAHAHAHADDDVDDVTRLIEFNNSVAVIMLMGLDKKINMWTLDDDACLRGGGVEASWTPMFSIDLGMPAYLIHGSFSNGNLLLILLINNVNMLISCNADKKEAKIVPLSVDMANRLYSFKIYKYKESLVSLAGFRHVD